MAGLHGGQEVTAFLYQCLKEVGLQRHCTRLAQVGVRRVAHLAALSVEDYPLLGIHSRRDCAQMLGLVQLVRALDPDEDEEEDPHGSDEGGDPAEGRCHCCCHDSEECGSGKAAATRAPPTPKQPTRRRLDFGCEETRSVPKATGTPRSQPAWESCGPVQGRDPALSPVMSGQGRAPATSGQGTASSMQMQVGLSAGRAACKCSECSLIVPAPSAAAITPPSPDLHGSRGRPPPRSSASQSAPPAGRAPPDMTQENSGSCRLSGKHTQVYERTTASGYRYGLPLRSPTAPKKKQPSTEPHISVCVRKRPLTRSEDRRGETDVVRTQDGRCLLVHEAKETVDLTHYILQHKFYFDQVFGEDCSNEEVFQMTACPLVQHLLLGGSSTCFAYGQTGAGKTHTMLGSPGAPGLYALAARDIFAHLHSLPPPPGPTPPPLPPPQPQVYVSFFEIYCGQLHDLLNHRKRLFAREDGNGVVQIAGLRHVQVDSVNALLEVVSWGREARTQGVSGVNSASSRSHALLQVQLRGPEQQLAGRMWFVDLAGSERAVDSGEPDRLGRLETADINQSLLALKECIRSLDQEQAHTPFRQSKLTQVLRDSFVGNSKTCMIANISPGHLATEHTLNTLRYANRVKELRGHKQTRGGSRGSSSSPSDPAFSPRDPASSRVGSASSRGKSPPKRAKTARPPREAVAPDDGGYPVLCSTPKSCGRGRGWGGGGGRRGVGPEHSASPVRASSRATAAGGGGGSGVTRHSKSPAVGAEPLSLPGRPEEGSLSRWVSERERERHLRWYHQQLQQGHSLASSSSSSSSATVASPPGRSSSPPAGRVESGRWAWLGATQTEQQWEQEEAGGLGGWREGQELKASGVVDDGGGSRPLYTVPPHHRAPAERPLSPGLASAPDRPPEEQWRGGADGGGGAPCSCLQDEGRRGCARSELLLGNNTSPTSSTFSTSSRLKEDVHGAEEKLWEAGECLVGGRTQTSVVPAVALQDPGCGQRAPTQPGDQVRGEAFRQQPPARPQPQEQSRLHKRQGATEHSSAVPTTLLPSLGDLSHAQLGVVQAHWEQLEAMETLCREEAELLCQQPDMPFRAYVQHLEGLMKRKAWCVQAMKSMLQTHLEPEDDLPATPNEQDPGGLV